MDVCVCVCANNFSFSGRKGLTLQTSYSRTMRFAILIDICLFFATFIATVFGSFLPFTLVLFFCINNDFNLIP